MEVFRDSDGREYRTKTVHELGERLTLVAFPHVGVSVRDVFA